MKIASLFIVSGIALSSFLLSQEAHAGAILQAPNSIGLSQGLVGWWTFDGNHISGVHAYDASGNGNRGIMANGPRLTEGKLGQGMQFDGGDDRVRVSTALVTGPPATFTGWIRPSTNKLHTLVSIGDTDVGGFEDNFVGITLDSTFAAGMIIKQGNNNDFTGITAGSGKIGEWHFVAGVWESGRMRVYLNDATNSASITAVPAGLNITDIGVLTIGGSLVDFAAGQLDDVRVYNRALSPDEIKRLYRIGATAKVGTTISNDSLQKGLVGHWSFDGDTVAGTHVYDQSGQGNRGVMTNGPKLVYGKIGQGMSFDGSDDYIDLGNVLGFTSSFSISAWVRIPDPTISCEDYIINKNAGPGERDWSLLNECGSLLFRVSADGTNLTGRYANENTAPNQWTYVTGVYRAATQELDVYVNGEKSNGVLTATIPASINATTNNVRIGSRESTNTFLKGLIDDVRVYNRALSTDEIKRLYKIGATAKVGVAANTDSLQKGLVGYWNFDGDTVSGTHVYDQSGQGNRGIMTNGPRLAMGKLGQGLAFDGVDDEIEVGTNGSDPDNLYDTAPLSISLWVKFNALSSTRGEEQRVIGKEHGGTPFHSWAIVLEDSPTDRLRFRTKDSGSSTFNTDSDNPLETRRWYHIVAIIDSNFDTSLFIDSAKQADTESMGSLFNSNSNVDIGSVNNSNETEGVIDDVRIYNRALNPDEIKRLYNMR